MINRIKRKIKAVKRTREIARVLIKHGFGQLTEGLNARFLRGQKAEDSVDKIPAPVRARMVLEELGPTFIKLGQMLSTRQDLLPKEYTLELKKLQDKAPKVPYACIRERIREEFDSNPEDLFDVFEKTPLAAASIAQVHAAIVGGEEAVTKVQRPGIEDDVESDIEILFELARLITKHMPESELYDPVGLVREFARSIRKEMDFLVEARNADRFKKNFTGDRDVYVPAVYWELTTKRVLTLERLRGTNLGKLRKTLPEEKRKEFADKIAHSYLTQILVHGFFHADPHPGNLFILESERIGFTDFGMVGRVDEYLKEKLSTMFIAIIRKDKSRVVDVLLDIGVAGDETSLPDFRRDVSDLLDEYWGTSLKQVSVSNMLDEVLQTAMKHRIRMPSNFALLLKTIITVESICGELSEDFNLTEVSSPFVESLLAERMQPRKVLEKFWDDLSELNGQVMAMPRKMNNILSKLQDGKLIIDLEHKGLAKFMGEIDASSNRISVSLILSAIIVGSSVVMLTGKGPELFEYPAIGVVGFLLAAVLGLWLVFSLLRTRRF